MGSDHCPVLLSGIVQLKAAGGATSKAATAALCARNFVEFAGKQQDIKAFFQFRAVSHLHHTTDEQNVSATGNTPPRAKPASTSSSPKLFSSPSSTPPRLRKRTSAGGKAPGKPSQPSILSFFGQSSASSKTAAGAGSSAIRGGASRSQETQDAGDESDVDVEKLLQGLESKREAAQIRQLAWRKVLSGEPPKTPLCFCQQPTVLRTVLKTNDNWGRKFYVCTKPAVRRVRNMVRWWSMVSFTHDNEMRTGREGPSGCSLRVLPMGRRQDQQAPQGVVIGVSSTRSSL